MSHLGGGGTTSSLRPSLGPGSVAPEDSDVSSSGGSDNPAKPAPSRGMMKLFLSLTSGGAGGGGGGGVPSLADDDVEKKKSALKPDEGKKKTCYREEESYEDNDFGGAIPEEEEDSCDIDDDPDATRAPSMTGAWRDHYAGRNNDRQTPTTATTRRSFVVGGGFGGSGGGGGGGRTGADRRGSGADRRGSGGGVQTCHVNYDDFLGGTDSATSGMSLDMADLPGFVRQRTSIHSSRGTAAIEDDDEGRSRQTEDELNDIEASYKIPPPARSASGPETVLAKLTAPLQPQAQPQPPPPPAEQETLLSSLKRKASFKDHANDAEATAPHPRRANMAGKRQESGRSVVSRFLGSFSAGFASEIREEDRAGTYGAVAGGAGPAAMTTTTSGAALPQETTLPDAEEDEDESIEDVPREEDEAGPPEGTPLAPASSAAEARRAGRDDGSDEEEELPTMEEEENDDDVSAYSSVGVPQFEPAASAALDATMAPPPPLPPPAASGKGHHRRGVGSRLSSRSIGSRSVGSFGSRSIRSRRKKKKEGMAAASSSQTPPSSGDGRRRRSMASDETERLSKAPNHDDGNDEEADRKAGRPPRRASTMSSRTEESFNVANLVAHHTNNNRPRGGGHESLSTRDTYDTSLGFSYEGYGSSKGSFKVDYGNDVVEERSESESEYSDEEEDEETMTATGTTRTEEEESRSETADRIEGGVVKGAAVAASRRRGEDSATSSSSLPESSATPPSNDTRQAGADDRKKPPLYPPLTTTATAAAAAGKRTSAAGGFDVMGLFNSLTQPPPAASTERPTRSTSVAAIPDPQPTLGSVLRESERKKSLQIRGMIKSFVEDWSTYEGSSRGDLTSATSDPERRREDDDGDAKVAAAAAAVATFPPPPTPAPRPRRFSLGRRRRSSNNADDETTTLSDEATRKRRNSRVFSDASTRKSGNSSRRGFGFGAGDSSSGLTRGASSRFGASSSSRRIGDDNDAELKLARKPSATSRQSSSNLSSGGLKTTTTTATTTTATAPLDATTTGSSASTYRSGNGHGHRDLDAECGEGSVCQTSHESGTSVTDWSTPFETSSYGSPNSEEGLSTRGGGGAGRLSRGMIDSDYDENDVSSGGRRPDETTTETTTTGTSASVLSPADGGHDHLDAYDDHDAFPSAAFADFHDDHLDAGDPRLMTPFERGQRFEDNPPLTPSGPSGGTNSTITTKSDLYTRRSCPVDMDTMVEESYGGDSLEDLREFLGEPQQQERGWEDEPDDELQHGGGGGGLPSRPPPSRSERQLGMHEPPESVSSSRRSGSLGEQEEKEEESHTPPDSIVPDDGTIESMVSSVRPGKSSLPSSTAASLALTPSGPSGETSDGDDNDGPRREGGWGAENDDVARKKAAAAAGRTAAGGGPRRSSMRDLEERIRSKSQRSGFTARWSRASSNLGMSTKSGRSGASSRRMSLSALESDVVLGLSPGMPQPGAHPMSEDGARSFDDGGSRNARRFSKKTASRNSSRSSMNSLRRKQRASLRELEDDVLNEKTRRNTAEMVLRNKETREGSMSEARRAGMMDHLESRIDQRRRGTWSSDEGTGSQWADGGRLGGMIGPAGEVYEATVAVANGDVIDFDEENWRKYERNRKIMRGLCLAMVLVGVSLVIAIPITILMKGKDGDDPTPSEQTVEAEKEEPKVALTPAPSPAPTTPAPTSSHYPDFLEYFRSTLKNNETLSDPFSPQSKAVRFLANVDPESLSLDEADRPRLTQRFSLLVLFYAVDPDADDLNWEFWGDSRHECEWMHVECYDFDVGSARGSLRHNFFQNQAGRRKTMEDIVKIHWDESVTAESSHGEEIVAIHWDQDAPSLTKRLRAKETDKGTSATRPPRDKNEAEEDATPEGYVRQRGEEEGASFTPPAVPDTGRVTGLFLDRMLRTIKDGNLPSEIGNLKGLETLDISDNYLKGTFPEEIYGLTNLELLEAGKNDFESNLGYGLGNLTNLEILNLNENRLKGHIPESISNLEQLTSLSLHHNRFSGPILNHTLTMSSLVKLDVSVNSFTGDIPTGIGAITALRTLNIGENRFGGVVPTEIGTLRSSLENLICSYNNIGGQLPDEIGNLIVLSKLYFDNCSLEGTIPTTIGNLKRVEELDFGANNIAGPIPTEIGTMRDVTQVSLHTNKLTGGIPKEIGKLKSLEKLMLDLNNLTGTTPDEVCDLRRANLQTFHADCFKDVKCAVPACCTVCSE